jgi:hypothetical protein
VITESTEQFWAIFKIFSETCLEGMKEDVKQKACGYPVPLENSNHYTATLCCLTRLTAKASKGLQS